MNSTFQVRQAIADDVPQIFNLIQALAEYEQLSHQVTGSAEDLRQHLFGERIYAEAIVTEIERGSPKGLASRHAPNSLRQAQVSFENKIVGFALFLPNYSTFLTKPGIYLEDLFVLPEYRRRGIAKAMLSYLGKLAIARNAGRLEWSVLDWNESAISFYRRMGAEILPDWRTCRVTSEALKHLANGIGDRSSTP